MANKVWAIWQDQGYEGDLLIGLYANESVALVVLRALGTVHQNSYRLVEIEVQS